MFCPDCGKKNDSEAVFCDECGTKLIKPVIKPKSGTDRILLWWKNRKTNNAIVLIIILLFIFSIPVISNLLKAPSSPENEPFEPYGNDSGTYYTSEYLSFSHNSFEQITHGNKLKNDKEIVSFAFGDGDEFGVLKPVETTESAYDEVMEAKKNMGSESNITTIQIAGVTGYKLDSMNYNNKGELSTHSINYFFVKNGKLYHLTFVSWVGLGKNDRLNMGNINKIINSIITY